MSLVAVVMGSASDLPVLTPGLQLLEQMNVPFTVRVLSAHRTPHEAAEFAENLEAAGTRVVIAAAGKAAHLAGVIAAHTLLPIIGLPVKSSTMDGLDSLLSTVQMPAGIPVATVAINGAENAALLAIQILALSDPALKASFQAFRKEQTRKVLEQDQLMQADWKVK